MSLSSLNVEKDFLSNADYLKALVKEVKSNTSLNYDSNLIYEVTYANMYVTDLLTKVNNPELIENINEIKVALDLIIADIPDKDVENAQSKLDYTKILKAKYDKIDDGSFEEEVAYSNIKESSVCKEYLKKRAPSIIVVFIVALIVFLGVPGMISEMLVTPEAVETNHSISKIVSTLKYWMDVLLNSVIFLLFSTFTVSVIFDLLYLLVPQSRIILDSNKDESRFVSIQAKSAIEEVDGQLIKYKKIKSYDRIKRNQYWLQSMIDTLTYLQKSGKKIDTNFAKSLVDLQCNLKACKERSKEWYLYIAKIEFMHDKYQKLIEGVVL